MRILQEQILFQEALILKVVTPQNGIFFNSIKYLAILQHRVNKIHGLPSLKKRILL